VVKFTGTTAGTGANAGAYNFTIVPVGVYTVHAFVGTLVGTSSATVTRGVNVVVPPITLEVGSFAPTDPTQFTTIGKIYTISIPYEDTGSPTTNNVSEPNPATTTVAKAFTIPPVDPNTGAINYLLQSWNPTTRAYVTLGNNSTISRGAGYLLQVVNTPTALVLPAGDPTRTPLNATVTTFTVTLHRNMSAASDPNDGLNLIGFGFNPAFSTASWTNAKVIYNGTTYASVTAAAAAGIISANLTTVDPTAASYSLVPTSSIAVYGGFYARTNYDGVQVVFSNPTP